MKKRLKRILEGYLYRIPFVGDRWVLTSKFHGLPPATNSKWFWTTFLAQIEGEEDVAKLFEGLVGKKVRVIVEVVESESNSEGEEPVKRH